MVARERFELSSAAPEAAMFDHCTTGLRPTESSIECSNNLNAKLYERASERLTLLFHGFFDAVAFLTAWVPVFAAPERVHEWVLVFREAFAAE